APARGRVLLLLGYRPLLHVRVVRPACTLGRNPVDVLGRVLDVAGLAVYAVLRVDLEALAAIVIADHLIHAGRAVTLGRLVVQRQVVLDRNARIGQLQVNRLFFFMVGVGHEDRRQLVEADDTVRLGIGDLRRFGGLLQTRMVRRGVMQRDRNLAAEPVLVDVVERTTKQG